MIMHNYKFNFQTK